MTEQNVTLQPGESKLVSFEATPHEAKVYQVSVDRLSGSFKAVRKSLFGRGALPSLGLLRNNTMRLLLSEAFQGTGQ